MLSWLAKQFHTVNEVEDGEDLTGHSVVWPGQVVQVHHLTCLASLQQGGRKGDRVPSHNVALYSMSDSVYTHVQAYVTLYRPAYIHVCVQALNACLCVCTVCMYEECM